MIVLDASAALAYLGGERGGDVVAGHLGESIMGTANLSEVLSKFPTASEAALAQSILSAQGVSFEAVTEVDASVAARLRTQTPHLSLGDRLCLALGERLSCAVITADTAWGAGDGIVQIRGRRS